MSKPCVRRPRSLPPCRPIWPWRRPASTPTSGTSSRPSSRRRRRSSSSRRRRVRASGSSERRGRQSSRCNNRRQVTGAGGRSHLPLFFFAPRSLLRTAGGHPALRRRLFPVHLVAVATRGRDLIGGLNNHIHVLRLTCLIGRHPRVAQPLDEALPVGVLHGHRLAVAADPSRNREE